MKGKNRTVIKHMDIHYITHWSSGTPVTKKAFRSDILLRTHLKMPGRGTISRLGYEFDHEYEAYEIASDKRTH